METVKNLPNITAKNIEDFTKIETALKTLPDCITNQISKATLIHGLGIECEFIRSHSPNGDQFYLPDFTTQIKDFGDYVGIYSGIFFFKIPMDKKTTCSFSYFFTETNNQ